jgi:hypothetical protein
MPRHPPAVYATARLRIAAPAGRALELVLGCLRPRFWRKAWWLPEEHLIAAANETDDLTIFARSEVERLSAKPDADPVALATARMAARELDNLAHRLRMRLGVRTRFFGRPGESCLRPSAAVRFKKEFDLPSVARIADAVAARKPRRTRRGMDRRPLVALRKDVEALALHLAPGTSWDEEWGDLRAITDLAVTANDLAERMERAVQGPDPTGRWRTRRYVPAPTGEQARTETESRAGNSTSEEEQVRPLMKGEGGNGRS